MAQSLRSPVLGRLNFDCESLSLSFTSSLQARLTSAGSSWMSYCLLRSVSLSTRMRRADMHSSSRDRFIPIRRLSVPCHDLSLLSLFPSYTAKLVRGSLAVSMWADSNTQTHAAISITHRIVSFCRVLVWEVYDTRCLIMSSRQYIHSQSQINNRLRQYLCDTIARSTSSFVPVQPAT